MNAMKTINYKYVHKTVDSPVEQLYHPEPNLIGFINKN